MPDPIALKTFETIEHLAQGGLEGDRKTMTEALASIQIQARSAIYVHGPFSFNEDNALKYLEEADDFEPIAPEVGADELNTFLEQALRYHAIEVPGDSAVTLGVYPESEAEPKPVLVINPGRGPLVMGSALSLGETYLYEADDPIPFSATTLENIVAEANELARAIRW